MQARGFFISKEEGEDTKEGDEDGDSEKEREKESEEERRRLSLRAAECAGSIRHGPLCGASSLWGPFHRPRAPLCCRRQAGPPGNKTSFWRRGQDSHILTGA